MSQLLQKWPISEKGSRPRIGRALYYVEKAAREYHFADRFELLVRTCEILWGKNWTENTSPEKNTRPGRARRFRDGLTILAQEFNINLTEEEAAEAWKFRSQVTHGIGLPTTGDRKNPAAEVSADDRKMVDCYLKVDEVLRRSMVRAIQDHAFASRFDSEENLMTWLTTGDTDESSRLATTHRL